MRKLYSTVMLMCSVICDFLWWVHSIIRAILKSLCVAYVSIIGFICILSWLGLLLESLYRRHLLIYQCVAMLFPYHSIYGQQGYQCFEEVLKGDVQIDIWSWVQDFCSMMTTPKSGYNTMLMCYVTLPVATLQAFKVCLYLENDLSISLLN